MNFLRVPIKKSFSPCVVCQIAWQCVGKTQEGTSAYMNLKIEVTIINIINLVNIVMCVT